jgi:hypothetical protein
MPPNAGRMGHDEREHEESKQAFVEVLATARQRDVHGPQCELKIHATSPPGGISLTEPPAGGGPSGHPRFGGRPPRPLSF